MKAENPFFGEYNTPYNIPPFEKIQIADYMPAFEEAIAQHNQEIAAIVNNRAVPDFENTIVALDNSGEMLEKVSYVFSGLYEVVSTPESRRTGIPDAGCPQRRNQDERRTVPENQICL